VRSGFTRSVELEAGHRLAQQVALCQTGHGTVTPVPYTGLQVNRMRFSSLFQPSIPLPEMRREEPVRELPQPVAAPARDLPEDLDARVRLIGEWQLGEA
jgi:hypothetical protein